MLNSLLGNKLLDRLANGSGTATNDRRRRMRTAANKRKAGGSKARKKARHTHLRLCGYRGILSRRVV